MRDPALNLKAAVLVVESWVIHLIVFKLQFLLENEIDMKIFWDIGSFHN